MVRVELHHVPGSPHLGATRWALRAAMQRLGLEPHWEEVVLSAAGGAEEGNARAVPRILVNGVMVVDQEAPDVAARERGPATASVDAIVQALLSQKW